MILLHYICARGNDKTHKNRKTIRRFVCMVIEFYPDPYIFHGKYAFLAEYFRHVLFIYASSFTF